MRGLYSAHLIFLNLVVIIIFCEQAIILRDEQAGLRLKWLKLPEIENIRQYPHSFLKVLKLYICEPK
jgi:hypothetical protein